METGFKSENLDETKKKTMLKNSVQPRTQQNVQPVLPTSDDLSVAFLHPSSASHCIDLSAWFNSVQFCRTLHIVVIQKCMSCQKSLVFCSCLHLCLFVIPGVVICLCNKCLFKSCTDPAPDTFF